jgi:UDP-2-acetamido-3-amino-2,3-dideoxy-glucuronate N-acetyltransferase
MNFYKHETSIVETEDSNIGENTKIWAFSHICKNVKIGLNCIIGEGVYIGPNVIIGSNVKIQNHSLIYEGVTIEDGVFIGPNVVTTNDIYPRSGGEWSDRFRNTFFKKNCSICANTTIVCGVIIGENAMVGAGSVVTKDIPNNKLAYGNPAKIRKEIWN